MTPAADLAKATKAQLDAARAEGSPARDTPEPPPPRSLIRKLTEVMAAVGRVPKRGRNDFHKYDYATEADIVDAIRGELASRGVMLIPEILDVTRERRDGRGELALLDGDGDDVVGERRPRPHRDERIEQAQAVLAAGDADGDAIARPQHREPAHRPADRFEHRFAHGFTIPYPSGS